MLFDEQMSHIQMLSIWLLPLASLCVGLDEETSCGDGGPLVLQTLGLGRELASAREKQNFPAGSPSSPFNPYVFLGYLSCRTQEHLSNAFKHFQETLK